MSLSSRIRKDPVCVNRRWVFDDVATRTGILVSQPDVWDLLGRFFPSLGDGPENTRKRGDLWLFAR